MTPILYAHPFSSYCQKVLVALYENATAFEYRLLSPEHPRHLEELAARRPLRRFPMLVDRDRTWSRPSRSSSTCNCTIPGRCG